MNLLVQRRLFLLPRLMNLLLQRRLFVSPKVDETATPVADAKVEEPAASQ